MARILFYGITVHVLLQCCLATFTEGQATLPRATSAIAVGYDASNDTILLLGGYQSQSRQQFVTFKDDHFNDIEPTTETSALGWCQHYTQIGNDLWILRDGGQGFLKVNTKTRAIEPLSISSPKGHEASCLTSTQDHLIVVGPATTVQIYNVKMNYWLSDIPSISRVRKRSSCAVVDDTVYAIAGWDGFLTLLKSIETLDISSMDSMSSQQWNPLSGSLTTGRQGTRAVVYGTGIYVIGGGEVMGYGYDEVDVIDTKTGACYLADRLAVEATMTAAIVVHNILFVFGGATGYNVYNIYQYSLLPTINPTVYPTKQPLSPSQTTTQMTTQDMHGQVPNTTQTFDESYGASDEPQVSANMHNESVILAIILSVVGACMCIVGVIAVNSAKFNVKPKVSVDEQAMEKPMDHSNKSNLKKECEKPKVIAMAREGLIGNDEFVVGSNTEVGETPQTWTVGTPGEPVAVEGIEYDVNEIGANEVKSWLDLIGQSKYFETFIQNGFDSMDLIKQINGTDDLVGIGISLRAHQLKIINEIGALK
eukprot:268525_1